MLLMLVFYMHSEIPNLYQPHDKSLANDWFVKYLSLGYQHSFVSWKTTSKIIEIVKILI